MTRPAVPPGLNWATVFLTVQDVNKAVEFYTTAFGFTINQVLPDKTGRYHFARISYHGTNVVLVPSDADETQKGSVPPVVTGTTSPIMMYLYTEDIEALYHKMLKQNLTILLPLHNKWWGDRAFRIVDPNGYLWEIAQNIA